MAKLKEQIDEQMWRLIENMSPQALVLVVAIIGGIAAMGAVGPVKDWWCAPINAATQICK
jgi:hypothetical protein